jgi:toxin-antitoxin system PIN domain toxin
VIAVDTNLLVYAHRAEMPLHAPALATLESLCAAPAAWAIPWPCAHEYVAVVTHPRIFRTPTPLAAALAHLRALITLPQVVTLAERDGYLDRLHDAATKARVQGGAIHDARIAALCALHGVAELWSADRDFTRYPALRARNPLVC